MLDSAFFAFREQKIEDGVSRMIAEELAECLFVIGDVVFLDEFNEMARRVERERGLGEVWVGGKKAARLAVNVGEVAAASAGDEDFTAGQAAVIEKGYAASRATTSNFRAGLFMLLKLVRKRELSRDQGHGFFGSVD